MGDLLEHELTEMDADCHDGCPCEMHRMVSEVRRHRATMARLESWASQLGQDTLTSGGTGFGPFMAAELRNRITGAAK